MCWRHQKYSGQTKVRKTNMGRFIWYFFLIVFLVYLLFLIMMHFAYVLYPHMKEDSWLKSLLNCTGKLPTKHYKWVKGWLLNNIAILGITPNKHEFLIKSIQTSLTAIGMASIGLTYINTVKSNFVVGFLVQKIIERYYPLRIWFFIGQGIFVILGIISTSLGMGFSAVLSLVGALLCLIYTIIMAVHVAFSEKNVYIIVRKYIETCTIQDVKAMNKAEHNNKKDQLNTADNVLAIKRERNRMIFHSAEHVAQFLNKQFCARELTPYDAIHSIDIHFLAELLGYVQPYSGSKESLPLSLVCQTEKNNNGVVANESENMILWENAVLYSLPAGHDDTVVFVQCLSDCIEMWGTLLNGIDDLAKQAAFARHLLCAMILEANSEKESAIGKKRKKRRNANYILLECGLIGFILKNSVRDRSKDTCFNWAFFLKLLSCNTESPPLLLEEKQENVEKICNAMCGDISMILLCYMFLAEYIHTFQTDADFNIDIDNIIEVCKDYCRNGSSLTECYLAYAWLLMQSISTELTRLPLRMKIVSAVPAIKAKVSVIFDRML